MTTAAPPLPDRPAEALLAADAETKKKDDAGENTVVAPALPPASQEPEKGDDAGTLKVENVEEPEVPQPEVAEEAEATPLEKAEEAEAAPLENVEEAEAAPLEKAEEPEVPQTPMVGQTHVIKCTCHLLRDFILRWASHKVLLGQKCPQACRASHSLQLCFS